MPKIHPEDASVGQQLSAGPMNLPLALDKTSTTLHSSLHSASIGWMLPTCQALRGSRETATIGKIPES